MNDWKSQQKELKSPFTLQPIPPQEMAGLIPIASNNSDEKNGE